MTRAVHALGAYTVVALAATWPLVLGLGRDVAFDLGDSVLNMWILSWDVEQIRHIASGDLSRVSRFFDANIFHPSPLTLAYSEHLIPQALQILPIYLVSGNPILCYNLLFLSTFVLGGLGMYLLVRELTGNAWAAFIGGLLFAFAPYRLAQSAHLQVLSAQWMPFVFYGFLRFFRTGQLRPLAGAAIALVTQNLSSGYYLLFFPPFVAAFVLWEIVTRGLWNDRRVWFAVTGAAVFVVALTLPFLLPYAELHEQPFASRSLAEVTRFSADVYSYGTAFVGQRIWGGLQSFPKPEGELFPGLVPIILAVAGVVLWSGTPTTMPSPVAGGRRWLTWLLAALAAGHAMAGLTSLLVRRFVIDAWLFEIQVSNIDQMFLRAGIALALLVIVSPPARAKAAAFMRTRGFYLTALLVALWLSLGPFPQSLGRPLDIWAPYRFLYEEVPGFHGVRVPARFAMIVACMLSVLGGFGAAALARWPGGRQAAGILGAAFLVEATAVPFLVNGMAPLHEYHAPEARLYRPARAPAVYREMARQPPGGVVVELPLGPTDFDLRAMYYSTLHWRPLLNGYSGFTPPHYGSLMAALSEIPRHPELSLQALRTSGATHLILHESAYRDEEGMQTAAVLREAGSVELFRDEGRVLFRLPR